MFLIKEVEAAADTVVTCNGLNCNFCSFLESFSNIYNFILAISFAAAVFLVVISGIFYLLNLGSRSNLERPKKILLGSLIGFAFILLGWVIIHGFLNVISYKNSGSFGEFKCEINDSTEIQDPVTSVSEKQYNLGKGNKISTYLSLGQYLESNDKIAEISGPLAASLFMEQLKSLGEGETLRFLAPAKEAFSNGNKEVFAPLLTVQKENGQIKIKEMGEVLNKYLAPALASLPASFTTSSNDLTDTAVGTASTVTDALKNVLLTDASGSTINTGSFSSANSDLVDLMTEIVKEDTLKKAKSFSDPTVATLVEDYLNNTDNPIKTNQIIGEILNKGVLETGNSLLVDRNSSLPSAEELAKIIAKKDVSSSESSIDEKNNNDSTSDKDKQLTSPNNNKPIVYPKTQDINNPPSNSQSDSSGDLVDKTDRKPPPDSLDQDDWLPGDGTKEAIKKALRRIEKRDPLRYEMVFRFVTHIGDAPGGGMCTGCGDIYVERKAKIYDIAHILIHEATHSGHDCTVGWGGFEMSQIEAIACANQMGSLQREKGAKDMKEFPKQSKEITYKSIEVRGFLCRYLDKVSPKGDLGSWVLQQPRDYAVITHKYHNTGPYVYGDPEAGITLNLAETEENVVKTVMTSQAKCKSSPPKDLPPVKACEGAPEIQID